MNVESDASSQDAVGTETQTNLQRLLTHLPAGSLAAKLVAAREAGPGDALREVLDVRLAEQRAAYGPSADQKD